jgi:hypothetical protein
MPSRPQGEAQEGEVIKIERPILFSAPMVRAILDGKKTETRRVIKPQPKNSNQGFVQGLSHDFFFPDAYYNDEEHPKIGERKICPYGWIGARLWVRETFWQASYYPGSETPDGDPKSHWGNLFHYAADGLPENTPNEHYPQGLRNGAISAPDPFSMWHKRPSIFMPRKFSRIILEILNIKVERLQDITEESAKAEGTEPMHVDDLGQTFKTYRRGFQTLWESINGAESWNKNPWVWVIQFRRAR